MKRITLEVGPDGKVTADADGWKGEGCIKETDRLLKALNGQVENRIMKKEFYVKEKNVVHIRE
uniref:DUF2997 domain-containing protein n=1 Tax=viral metagenome TaxID=1070528 RepID=A0A6M3JZR0_9ZZZZ